MLEGSSDEVGDELGVYHGLPCEDVLGCAESWWCHVFAYRRAVNGWQTIDFWSGLSKTRQAPGCIVPVGLAMRALANGYKSANTGAGIGSWECYPWIGWADEGSKLNRQHGICRRMHARRDDHGNATSNRLGRALQVATGRMPSLLGQVVDLQDAN
ncbi:hypothetical protein NM208_g16884 [Fusarium decemcellulare]|uniref:Uncharacterized protein n=1 Tax=Fusarium decemcellulare TaxID=57161 RepID=A0ACC1RAN6_9HYPO|nr:hypothetical protein NM208_g16884 [Fusarium decemcellulare]